MAKTNPHSFSSSMQVDSELVGMAWEKDDTAKQQLPFTFGSKYDFQLALFPELMHHHHQLLYPMNTSLDNKSYHLLTDSHVVPDEDDHHHHHPCDYYHSQVAPATRVDRSDYDNNKTAPEFDQRTYLFDLEKPPDDAAAVTMINSKTIASISSTNHDAADYKDLVVPHHHDYDTELSLASKHPNSDLNSKLPASNPNEAEIALVPSLSVCSNDLPHPRDHQDQDAQSVKEQSQQSLTNKSGASRKRKYNRATTMAVRSVLKRKQRVKINRKMRALQGLIPNCEDKVDKAAILDDAIVYLKTLQLQLQMMSMPPPPMHLTPFPMLGFSPFVPLPPTLILPHPSITLPASINSHHLLKHDYNQSSSLP